MSERGTKEPSELARKIAAGLYDVYERATENMLDVTDEEYRSGIAQAWAVHLDRELAPFTLVPVEVLEQAIEAMERHHCPRCEAALSALYAAVDGSGEGK